jgi:hypothetical protein
MLTIIHGSDTALSRKYFFDQKDKIKDADLINGQKITLTDLIQLFEGGSLFAEPKNFFFEELIGKKKKSSELDQMIKVINKNSVDNNIYLWEGKELTPANIKQFENAVSKIFKLPQTLFVFLDSIAPSNGRELVKLFHKTIESTDTEMVFFMIVRQIRLMLYVKEPGERPIEEIARMSWQMQKLRSQAAKFDTKKLLLLYQKLFEIEKGLKTGTLPIDLVQAIDLCLLSI